ncbi:MAG: hypothetical protein GY830_07680 [Bacteroidetes bacterium]|nr:hypothetical protein [Bacteroidota bacterium]
MLFPLTIEREYMRELNRVVDILKQKTKSILIPVIPAILEEANFLRPKRKDAYADDIVENMEKLRFEFNNAYTERDMEDIALKIGTTTVAFQGKQLKRTLSTMIGLDIFLNEPWLNDEIKGFVESNVRLIKSIPEQYFYQIEEIVFRGARSGLTGPVISKEIRSKFNTTRKRADLIARDQMSKFNGSLNNLRQRGLGVTKYVWRDSNDNRVRPSHNINNGQIFSWDEPPFSTGHPGEDYQCRCSAEPYLQDLL